MYTFTHRHRLRLHGLEYPSYEPYPGFDHIQDSVFTCTQRNLVFHILVYMVNTSILVSDCCILFAQLPVTFIDFNTNPGNFEIGEKRDHCGLYAQHI